jgi:class 3 adenylate cyclase
MRCGKCGSDNPAGKKFCGECGVQLANRCPRCGVENPEGKKFCGDCGTSLSPDGGATSPTQMRSTGADTPRFTLTAEAGAHETPEGERKTVTALFADIKGSMELMEDLDPEEARAIVDPALKLMIDAVHRFAGYVVQSTGDGIFALFGAPVAHEDHPQRALYAALRMQEELSCYSAKLVAEGGLPIEARVGVNTGEVVVRSITTGEGHTEYTPIGHTANLAARMQAIAPTRSIAISEQTRKVVEGYFALKALGLTRVKGVSEPVNVFEVTGVGALRSRLEVSRARGFSRFVGRGGEMEALDAALAQAQAGNGQVVGIVAEAGTGKSRLCFEFLERCRARGLTIQVGRAVAHGRNIPYLPMLEAFRNYFGITDADSDRAAREKIAGRLLLTSESFRELLPVVFEFFGVTDPERPPPRGMDPEAKQRQLFAALRKEVREGNVASQVVTLIEDLHWMDAGSEAFLDQWVEAIAGSHALLLVTFRPEHHVAWSSKSYYRQIPLAPLGADAVRELLDDLLGADASIAGLAKTIYERTGGNPFFTEEVIQSLIESGALEGTRSSYRLVRPVGRLQVPPTVQALLAARIDRLGEREKQVLQTAAVIGKDFAEPVLRRVVEETGRSLLADADLHATLRSLKDAEFIYEQTLYPVAEYAFKHPLTQEVALHSQLQERRRRVHAAVARALEEAQGERLDETAALLAHHHEEAGEMLSAARWHRRAAEWVGLSDFKAALYHSQRVHELARQVGDGAEAAGLTAVACYSQAIIQGWHMGSTKQLAELFEEGCAAAQRAGDLAALAMLNSIYAEVRGFIQGIAPDQVRYASEAVRIADHTGDAALRCVVRPSLMWGHMWCGQPREAERVADEIIELAREDPDFGAAQSGGSPLLAARAFRPLCIGFTRDPATLLRELPLGRQLALDSGYPEQALWMMSWGALLKCALGSSDGLRALALSAARLAENLGVGDELEATLAQCAALACEREWQALLDAAGDALRLIRERGAPRINEPVCLAYIATAQLELGNLVGGRAAAEEGVRFMRESKAVWYPHSYAVLARAQLELGEPAAAIAGTLDEYAALLERTGLHLFEGELHELRARLVAREGNPADQAAALQRAYECHTRFGMTAQAARVKEAMG